MSNLNIKVEVSAIGGQAGRVEREAWNAAASLRPSGVEIQIVSQIGVVLCPVAKTRPLASRALFGWSYAQCWARLILNLGTFMSSTSVTFPKLLQTL